MKRLTHNPAYAVILFLLLSNYFPVFSQCNDLNIKPFTDNFEATEEQSNWQVEDINNDSISWALNNDFSHNGTQCLHLFVEKTTTNHADDWCFSPCIKLDSGKTYQLDFYYLNITPENYDGNLSVSLFNAPNSQATNLTLVNIGAVENNIYQLSSITFTATTGGNYYLGFHVVNNSLNPVSVRIDDISLSSVSQGQ